MNAVKDYSTMAILFVMYGVVATLVFLRRLVESTKYAFCIVMLVGLMPIVTFAKDKSPLVYDQTGTITFSAPHYDSTSTVEVGGTTYTAGCNTTDTDVSCSDYAGSMIIEFGDGTHMVFPLIPDDEELHWSTCDDKSMMCDPMMNLMQQVTPDKPIHFSFRWMKLTHKHMGGDTFTCYFAVSFSITDKHGKEKPQERWYSINPQLMWKADGSTVGKTIPSQYHYAK
jgi:hypothetical protein